MEYRWALRARVLVYRLRTVPERKAKRIRLALYSLTGVLVGVFLLHPFSMLVFSRTHNHSQSLGQTLVLSFRPGMLGMWLGYGGLGLVCVLVAGLLVNRIRIFEGLMPVCAWCGMICDKERTASGRVWKRLDQYLLEKGVRETHGLCPQCFEKLKNGLKKRASSSARVPEKQNRELQCP